MQSTTIKKLLSSVVLAELKEKGSVIVPVYGLSMFPILLPGCKVQISSQRYEVGDILLLKFNEKLVLHRLIRYTNTKVMTKGDGMVCVDSFSLHENVLGKVVAIQRKKRSWRDFQIGLLDKVIVKTFHINGYVFYFLGLLWSKIRNR